jgi:hypothetical protein
MFSGIDALAGSLTCLIIGIVLGVFGCYRWGAHWKNEFNKLKDEVEKKSAALAAQPTKELK